MPATNRFEKQLRFAAEYLVDLNATHAAIRAGYSKKTAGVQGADLLKRPRVAQYIAEHSVKREEATGIDAERVLREVYHAAFFDPKELFDERGAMLPLSEIPEPARRAIAQLEVVETFEWVGEGKERRREWTGYLKKVKLVSKEGMLTLTARHLGMLNDKLAVTVSDERVEKLLAAQARANKARGIK